MWCKRERERVSELSTQYTLFSLIYSWCSHIQYFPHGNCGCFQESSTYFVGFSCLADYYFLSPSVDVKYLKKRGGEHSHHGPVDQTDEAVWPKVCISFIFCPSCYFLIDFVWFLCVLSWKMQKIWVLTFSLEEIDLV